MTKRQHLHVYIVYNDSTQHPTDFMSNIHIQYTENSESLFTHTVTQNSGASIE